VSTFPRFGQFAQTAILFRNKKTTRARTITLHHYPTYVLPYGSAQSFRRSGSAARSAISPRFTIIYISVQIRYPHNHEKGILGVLDGDSDIAYHRTIKADLAL